MLVVLFRFPVFVVVRDMVFDCLSADEPVVQARPVLAQRKTASTAKFAGGEPSAASGSCDRIGSSSGGKLASGILVRLAVYLRFL